MPTHLCDLYVRVCENLNAEESAKVHTLLMRYKDVFAKHDFDLGCFSEMKHQIYTGSGSPVRQKMCRTSRDGLSISLAKLDAVKSWPVPTDKREVESFLGYAN